jgi:hypothetical protein
MAEEKQDGQKTLVAFVVGLLIGGLLVWAFNGPSADAPANSDDESSVEQNSNEQEEENEEEPSEGAGNDDSESAPVLQVGDGKINVDDQPAGRTVQLESAVYPVSEGWVGVRDYNNDQLGMILGVVRFSESQGLVPTEIVLQRPTTAGNRYAIVVYTENGDFQFSLANDVQIDNIFDTFVAE